MEFDKFVFVKKRTMLEELLRRHSTTSQAKFYLESAGKSYSFYEESHKKDKGCKTFYPRCGWRYDRW